MSTPISQFDYLLPKELIAQHSVEPRDSSRLMLLNRATGEIEHKHFYDIVDELNAGDVLVFNDTKVFRARLRGKVMEWQSDEVKEVEVFLLRCEKMEGEGHAPPVQGETHSTWQALLRPGKKVRVGDSIIIDTVEVVVKEKHDDGVALLEFPMDEMGVLSFTDAHGSIPVPPYVGEVPDDASKYQTVYAREVGSVAAPTAGFHFTNGLLDKIKTKGVETVFVTLHVGIGTFRPVQTETIEEHVMHAEFVTISKETAQQINRAKKEGRRVIAVGTTTVRSLEGAAMLSGGKLPEEFSGDINMFIKPGFEFCVIDALITNFHLPKSTLLVLVSALAGREHILHAYEEAVRDQYRFFSFGDAMFIR
jgi:S-adenosylmethionine:tRNA ribosyltransferase-isomerase